MKILTHYMRIKVLILLFFIVISDVSAQSTRDFQTQTSIGLSWKPLKRLELNPKYRLTLGDNSTTFRNSMLSLGADYDVLKWLKIGGEYRYYTSYKRDRHRMIVFTRANYKTGKYDLSYRLQYQQQQDYFDSEYLQAHEPNRVLRNKVQVRYSYNKKIDLYTYVESFTRRSKGEFNFYRMRYGLGSEYLYKRRHSFKADLYVNDEFNLSDPEDRLTLAIGYTFHVEKKKKKAKKKAAQEQVK
jgi:hypothetical protein